MDGGGVEDGRLALAVAEVVADVRHQDLVVIGRVVQDGVDFAQLRVARAEGVHRGEIGAVGRVAVPTGGQLPVVLRHLHVGAGLRHGREGDVLRQEVVEVFVRQIDARVERVVAGALHAVHGKFVRQGVQRGGVHHGLDVGLGIGERGVLRRGRDGDEDGEEGDDPNTARRVDMFRTYSPFGKTVHINHNLS